MIARIATRIAIFRLCRAVRRRAVARGVPCSVSWFGAYKIHPKYLVVLIRVSTDAEKLKLTQDEKFGAGFKKELARVAYPKAGRDGVVFDVESQETVDREWEGSWWDRIK